MTEQDKIIQDLRAELEWRRKDNEVLSGLIDALRAELEEQSRTLKEVREEADRFIKEATNASL